MEKTKIIMGMLVTIDIVDSNTKNEVFDEVFNYLISIDEKFSPYKKDSELTKYNNKKIIEKDLSENFKIVLSLSEDMKNKTDGFFDVVYKNNLNPSGLVKGWAIYNAKKILIKNGIKNFYIEIAGDIEVAGLNHKNEKWIIGIRSPFNKKENIKILHLTDRGIATSGLYERGNHIYNPKKNCLATEIESLTVIGPNIYEADCYATAGFAMGKNGIDFIEKLSNFEGYMIDHNGIATFTSNFNKYLQ